MTRQVILVSRKGSGPRREQATIVAAEAEEQMGTLVVWFVSFGTRNSETTESADWG